MTFSTEKLIRDLTVTIEENETIVKMNIGSIEILQRSNIELDKASGEAANVLARLLRPREPEYAAPIVGGSFPDTCAFPFPNETVKAQNPRQCGRCGYIS